MAKDTIDLRQDADYDMLVNKSMNLDAVLTAQYYTGDTAADIVNFDFTAYTGATLMVKQSYRSQTPVVEFNTSDGSLVLGTTGGTFQMIKTAEEMQVLPIGTYQYSMYLESSTQTHRAFLSGAFIIEAQII